MFTRVCVYKWISVISLQWRHNERDGVSNHQPHGCFLNRLFRRRSKKTSKLHVTGLCVGNSSVTSEFPHKGPVTRKMFPFDDVIMLNQDKCVGFFDEKWQTFSFSVNVYLLVTLFHFFIRFVYIYIWYILCYPLLPFIQRGIVTLVSSF